MKPEIILNPDKKKKIRDHIKNSCTPRHVPEKIIQVKGIPYTINGKKVELSVKNIIDGKNIENINAIHNPHTLKYFKDLEELKY